MVDLRLKELRGNKKLTQAEVANRLHISREAYSRYESGEREMTYDTLIYLAELFSVSVDYILGCGDHNSMVLNDGEIPMIYKYRELDERGKSTIQAMMAFEHLLSSGE